MVGRERRRKEEVMELGIYDSWEGSGKEREGGRKEGRKEA